jgi:alkane 1-monooxygenase
MEIPARTISPLLRRRVRLRALRYLVTFIAPAWGVVSLLGHGAWTWGLPLHGFLIVPLLEILLPHPPDNLSEEEEAAALDDPLFDAVLYLLVPLHWGILILFLFQVNEPGLALSEIMGRTASMGILCGIYGINVAHELGHRAKRWERDLARVLLLSSLYMHFIIEHNRGHHHRVATPEDPASARYGEWLYAFWLRSIVFGFESAWRIEAKRQRKEGHAPYGWRNEMLQALVWQGALIAAIALVFGPTATLAFLGAALVGILLLETVNYIEHYGLRRAQDAKGHYRRVQHVHSWNSDHRLGRLTLFELTRHSDHHWKASRPYQVLRSVDLAPQLPTGYPGTMLLSLVPPLFFAVMHPRIKALAAEEPELRLARE